jgi:hypothetical protein
MMMWIIKYLIALIIIIVKVNCSEDPVVRLANGNGLRGIKLQSFYRGRPYTEFRGIPYAEPPFGDLRFKVSPS